MFNININEMLLRLPAIIIALTVHEFSHGYAAYLLGDKTAKYDGRLSFNPLKHIDPIGMLFLLIVGFGWAKPVMVNPGNFKNPKQDMAITALAGPVSNFIMAFIVVLIYYPVFFFLSPGGVIVRQLFSFFRILLTINIVLGIFNLLPIPPLDGSKVFAIFLPDHTYFRFTGFRYGFIILIILIYSGVTFRVIQPFMDAIIRGYLFAVDKIYFFL